MKAWTKDKVAAINDKTNKLLEKVVWIEEGIPITIKISALAKKLGISKDLILKYHNMDKLDHLKDNEILDKLKDLELLEKRLNLPILDLLSHSESKDLDEYLLRTITEIKWFDEQGRPSSTTISALATKLGIPELDVLKYVKAGSLSRLKELENTSTSLKIPLITVLDYVKSNGIVKLNEMILLAKNLNLPILELLSHSKKLDSKELDKYLLSVIKEIQWFDDQGNLIPITISTLAQQLDISELKILKYLKRGEFSELQDLERISKKMNLHFHVLLSHKEKNTIEEYLFSVEAERAAAADKEWATTVDVKCEEIFKKLDSLFAQTHERVISQTSEGDMRDVSAKDLESIKKIIKSAYLIFGKTPPQGDQILFDLAKKHRILVKASGDSIAITGLFGKCLGAGAFGVAIQTIDLVKGEWVTGDEAVLKVANIQIEKAEKDEIIQEHTLIKKIHDGKQVLGIQKPLRIIRNVVTGEVSYSHLGPRYQKDLKGILPGDGDTTEKLKKEDQISLAYQLLSGVSHMHSKSITHGDIKPGNIFCDFEKTGEESTGPLLYLGDFGGGIDHSTANVTLQKTVTPQFRLNQDNEASEKAHKAGNNSLYMEIEKKADVFATCSVIYSLFTNEQPYQLDGDEIGSLNLDLKAKLANSGLSEATIDLLIKGLSPNYKKRPDAATILNAIQADLKKR